MVSRSRASRVQPLVQGSPAPRARPLFQGAPEPIAALNRVRIREATLHWSEREPLVDVRVACPRVIVAEKTCPFLRRRVAEMLNSAGEALPEGYRLRVATALRTFAMQKSGWDRYFERMREEHPTWPLSALRRATNKYHAPYDQKAPPGHCTGGAVDVLLVSAADEPVDVTSPTEGWDAAYTWSEKLAPESKANRMLMVEAMLSAGFSNCRDEYWHYSWGDSAWAVRVGEYECPFGWAHPPVCLETDFPEASATDLAIETTRDFNGRALRAQGSSRVPEVDASATEPAAWRVGLYWARDVPVTVRVTWPGAPSVAVVYAGPSLQELEPLAEVAREGDVLTIRITPAHDRVILSNQPPAAPEAK
jgi:D-alanyl-D-alanine dipeptidase